MKKTLIIFLLTFMGIGNLISQTCLPEGILFTTQGQIDSFAINYPGCTNIEGSIEIEESIGFITNLDGLSQIETIEGFLHIHNNSFLFDVDGLENLSSIGGFLKFYNNPNLQNLDGLENLTIIGGYLHFWGSTDLQNLLGLQNLTTIGGYFRMYYSDNLQNLEGLENLTMINGEMYLNGNENLQNLEGLENLTTINGDLQIGVNDNLQSLDGLENLQTLGGSLGLIFNDNLADLSALQNLTTIGQNLFIQGNDTLQSLSGLENLTTIEVGLVLYDNINLESINELESLVYIGDEIQIEYNTSLPMCNTEVICNHLLTQGNATILDNAPGCSTVSEVLAACIEEIDHTSLIGNVIADIDTNCEESSEDWTIGNWLVEAYNDDYSLTLSADSLGDYWIPVLEGDWTLNVISPYDYWTSCFIDTLIYAAALNDSITTDFFMQAQGDCAFMDWNVIAPPIRICEDNTFVINYCNVGTQVAEDIIIAVSFDEFLTLENASMPYTIDNDLIFFDIGTVDVFECDQITLTAFLDCDGVELGEVQCMHVEFMPNDLCAPDPAAWDGSTITVNGFCENDSIHFELKNIGGGNMSEEAQFRVDIVIDDIILLQDVDNYQLIAGDTKMLSYEIDDMTVLGMRLEADQTPGHPINGEASVVVPNCDDIENNIILTLLPSEDGDPFMESFCSLIVAAFDPNIKSAIPVGVGENHEIDKDWRLDYMIQFQNTGNAEAYIVVLKDTLSENLDLTTLSVTGASHDFTWALNPDRELVFTFDDIYLPDSTSNEPESHGFVQFSISPKSTILPGETIENRAGIYFDFNDPIITNTVLHTIRKPVVASSEHLQWCAGDVYDGQEIWENITIQIETNFAEYDSIHFVHLEVVEQMETEVFENVNYGEYFENVLIESDTTFTHTYTSQTGCDSLVTYTVSVLTSTEETERILNAVNIYPNPTSSEFIVSNHINGEAQEWILINNIGKQLWIKTLDINEILPKLSLSDYPSGVYFLKMKTESGTAVWKIVKR